MSACRVVRAWDLELSGSTTSVAAGRKSARDIQVHPTPEGSADFDGADATVLLSAV